MAGSAGRPVVAGMHGVDSNVVRPDRISARVQYARRVGAAGTSIFDSIPPDMIEAIEIYTASNVPAQFNRGNSGCGVVVLWMRPNR